MAVVLPADYSVILEAAVKYFWQARVAQLGKQRFVGSLDQGNRGAVTGGKQLDGFVGLIRHILLANGVPPESVFVNSKLELPGYYRPNKKWDFLIVDDGKLIAAIEFKSQVGPSFGNNFNNRTEEAMGSALDLWTAYREGLFGNHIAPWLGYFFVLEDCEKSSVGLRVQSPHFPVLPEFAVASYKVRYQIFCQKLMRERQYSAACLITTKRTSEGGTHTFPCAELDIETFMLSMLGAVLAYFARKVNDGNI